jgi:hypothetical protein
VVFFRLSRSPCHSGHRLCKRAGFFATKMCRGLTSGQPPGSPWGILTVRGRRNHALPIEIDGLCQRTPSYRAWLSRDDAGHQRSRKSRVPPPGGNPSLIGQATLNRARLTRHRRSSPLLGEHRPVRTARLGVDRIRWFNRQRHQDVPNRRGARWQRVIRLSGSQVAEKTVEPVPGSHGTAIRIELSMF